MDKKFYFGKDIYIKLNYTGDYKLIVKEGQVISEKGLIAKFGLDSYTKIHVNKPKVKVGGLLKKSDIIGYTEKNVEIKATFDSKVINIDNKDIYLENISEGVQHDVKPELKNIFHNEVVVKNIYENNIYLKTDGNIINLLTSKGQSESGDFIFMDYQSMALKKTFNIDVSDKILLTDYVDQTLYPKLASFGVKAIIVNSVHYSFYKSVVLLSVPIGVVTGFGRLNMDKKVKEVFSAISKLSGVLDTENNRLIIPGSKELPSIRNIKFDINWLYKPA